MNRPLIVRCQVTNGDAHLTDVAWGGLIEERSHVEWRPVHREVLAEPGHPVVVEVEGLATCERGPRLEPLDLDRERGVPAATALRARPLRRGDPRGRSCLGVGEGDLLA